MIGIALKFEVINNQLNWTKKYFKRSFCHIYFCKFFQKATLWENKYKQ